MIIWFILIGIEGVLSLIGAGYCFVKDYPYVTSKEKRWWYLLPNFCLITLFLLTVGLFAFTWYYLAIQGWKF